jgi:TetR/AcrR family transcriptional regulator, transcriptional repressor of bet genes
MPRPKKKAAADKIPRARSSHSRQHQLLIDACISALHLYGPSRTTVEKVVAIAKMSPGIVRFYFASKAAMLVASLQFLAREFEEQLMVPVLRLKANPVAALELLVDLYLDPELASPRKVSVWYAFWGEASSRQEYYDICGQKDESFAVLCRDLIERLIVETSQSHLDPDAIALGLIGVLEITWQDFAFKDEADIDRVAAKRRCMAYLSSIFPGRFRAGSGAAPRSYPQAPAAWMYEDARLFALERERVFQPSWQLAGHIAWLAQPGDFISMDLGVERALLLCDARGRPHAFRNSCSEAPHALIAPGAGRIERIECAVHGLEYNLDGKRVGSRGTGDLQPLECAVLGDLVFVRSSQCAAADGQALAPWADLALTPGTQPIHRTETPIAADWKLVVEQWLDSAPARHAGWSARQYRRLVPNADAVKTRQFIAPNHWVEARSDGLTILQVLPAAPGRCVLRHHHYTYCETERVGRATQYLASRLSPLARCQAIAALESTQRGLVNLGLGVATAASDRVAEFRRMLAEMLPVTAFQRS